MIDKDKRHLAMLAFDKYMKHVNKYLHICSICKIRCENSLGCNQYALFDEYLTIADKELQKQETINYEKYNR